MSTIANLISLIDPSAIRPWSQGMQDVNREVIGRQQAQTGLIELQQLKEKQQAEQLFLEQVKNNPDLARQLLGDGSVLGSLGTAGAPPGGMPGAPPGPITQGTLGPGGVGGTATPSATGLSPRGFAPEGATPQQSILASLGPQGGMPGPPQGPPQGQQNPALAMAAQNPRAALLMQQQMQASQDRQWKLQEQQMTMGVKVAEFVARELQGVTDQASLDQARERVRQVHPQAAAQMPQTYSKEAVESVQQRGIAIAERAKWDKDMATAQKTREETRLLPELFKDAGTSREAPAQAPPNGTVSTPSGTQARTAPTGFESAITEANKLYPQVSTARIKSIIAAESSYDPKAESSKGAKGAMGLMDDTAREMGVKDSFNVQENVRGGTRYYAQLLTKYGGDERKALTAYNWGMGNFAKAGDDVTKAPPETQAYVAKVLGGGGGAGTDTGTTHAPPAHPHIAQLDAQIAEGTRKAKQAAALGYESLSTRYHDDVQRLQAEKNRLVDRSTEIPRAVEKQTALEPGELRKARAAAEVSNEAKMNEPIGAENAIKMDLPPQTKWKDVPKDTKVLDRPGEGVATKLGEYTASHAGITRVLGMLDQPGASSIIGTLFSEPDASFRRRAGEWISSVTPQERKFAAAMVAEIASIRHNLAGSAVSPEEAAFVKEMMPKTSDPDVGTVRAKLEVLQEWVANKHEGMRDQLEQMRFRAPKPLPRSAPAQPSSGLTSAQQALIDKHRNP